MFLIDPTSTSPALPKFKFDTGQLSADLLDGSAAQPIFLKRCPLADPQYTPPIATKTRQCHPSFPDGNQTRRISFEKCSLADVRYAPTVSATTRRRTAAFRDGGESDQKLGTAPRLQEATHVDAASSSLMYAHHAAHNAPRLSEATYVDAISPSLMVSIFRKSSTKTRSLSLCRATATSVGNDVTSTASQNPARCSSEHEATGGESAGGRAV
ncbi:hypothetical protein C8J57DRAFT_1227329 [Mycena rebaudengoi]|nr:hypothetical protein C8J57DRAFT_1227326 [Mycena rebaudengoi]KAJ7269587.1 hypothetical protein C8J57DRAFT_1227329 [Mycena rebaudengoi]